MKRTQTKAILVMAMTMSCSVLAAPHDALINNDLSLPGELNKSVVLETPIAEVRGEVWPFILGVAALDLALQTYFYGVYVPSVSEK